MRPWHGRSPIFSPTSTSPLSHCFLRTATAGHVSEHLHGAVASIMSGNLDAAIAAVRNIGHSSGWDMLAGIATTLRIVAAKSAERIVSLYWSPPCPSPQEAHREGNNAALHRRGAAAFLKGAKPKLDLRKREVERQEVEHAEGCSRKETRGKPLSTATGQLTSSLRVLVVLHSWAVALGRRQLPGREPRTRRAPPRRCASKPVMRSA
jgi:Protein of unknown function (DUF2877)